MPRSKPCSSPHAPSRLLTPPQALFASVATLSDRTSSALNKLATSDTLKQKRVVINLRKRMLAPVYEAWRDRFREEKALRTRCLRRALHMGLTRSFTQWEAVVDERRRLARFMRRALGAT